jgi:hypothetical protein
MRAKILTAVLSLGLAGAVSITSRAQTGPQAPAPVERKLELKFDGNGNASLVARGVPVQDVLTEWTRQGGSSIEGAERLGRAPIDVVFQAQPEADVLTALLRTAAGVMLVPRTLGSVGLSRLDVRILAISSPTAASSNYFNGPAVNAPPVTTAGNPADEIPPVNPAPPQNAPAQAPGAPSGPKPPGVVPITPISPGTTGTTGSGRGGGGGGAR